MANNKLTLTEQRLADALEYWLKRCVAAENYIFETPSDPDIFAKQLEAYNEWQDLVKDQPQPITNG